MPRPAGTQREYIPTADPRGSGVLTRSTEESERTEIQESADDLLRAKEGLASAAQAASAAAAGPYDPLTEAHDRQWVRVALAERRSEDALDAHIFGERRRARKARLHALIGRADATANLPPRASADRPGASPEARATTLAFIAGTDKVAHSEAEDLHPARLDPASADLERALATTPLQRRIAERDARDA